MSESKKKTDILARENKIIERKKERKKERKNKRGYEANIFTIRINSHE